ncbi:MAG: AsmA family protein, partial [Bacteroidota bacterium]
MKKFFRRFLLLLVLFLVIVLGGLAIVVSFFEDELGQKVVQSVNKQLKSELTIDEVDLTVFRSFPNAAINLRNTTLQDRNGNALLDAENVSFRFRLLSLLGKSIKVNSILLENGVLAIRYDERGQPNYEVFNTSEEAVEEEASRDFGISLQEARLSNIELIYEDEAIAQAATIMVEDAVFSGEFSSEQFSLQSNADLQSKFVVYGEDRFLQDRDLRYDATILVDLTEGMYEMEQVTVGVEDNEFAVKGRILSKDDFTDFNLVAKNKEGDLGGVLQLLPESYRAYLGDFSSRGQFYFDALIDGRLSETESPLLDIKFGLEDGRISSPRLDNPFKDVSFDAKFTNGERRINKSPRF